MEGLTGYIAQLSMTMAQQNIQASFSTGMLKNVMDSQEAANAELLDMLSAPSPDGKGMVLDVRA
ncbi:MAG: YjfB family protein [Bacteroides sp.]|nr:YjfB family protein [Eubacterium sp.]MCM1417319.1 YjfB family protein [Roseburia sp.]MCM1461488.1 YjfB family protein [Bacteroides sp.]